MVILYKHIRNLRPAASLMKLEDKRQTTMAINNTTHLIQGHRNKLEADRARNTKRPAMNLFHIKDKILSPHHLKPTQLLSCIKVLFLKARDLSWLSASNVRII